MDGPLVLRDEGLRHHVRTFRHYGESAALFMQFAKQLVDCVVDLEARAQLNDSIVDE